MKKKYISPQSFINTMAPELLTVASTLSTEGDTQTITISNEEVNEFTSRRHNVWADEELDDMDEF